MNENQSQLELVELIARKVYTIEMVVPKTMKSGKMALPYYV